MAQSTTTENSNNLTNIASNSPQTSSIDSDYTDPDRLIREYFLSSPSQRAKSRKQIVKSVNSLNSVGEVLKWGISGNARDAYDGAVDLLAEINNINLLIGTSNYLEKLAGKLSNDNLSDSRWEILIKAIVCAYQIPAEERYKLISSLILVSNRRLVKATIIDALLLIADEIDVELIRTTLERYVSSYETDQYIRNYAEEALQDIS